MTGCSLGDRDVGLRSDLYIKDRETSAVKVVWSFDYPFVKGWNGSLNQVALFQAKENVYENFEKLAGRASDVVSPCNSSAILDPPSALPLLRNNPSSKFTVKVQAYQLKFESKSVEIFGDPPSTFDALYVYYRGRPNISSEGVCDSSNAAQCQGLFFSFDLELESSILRVQVQPKESLFVKIGSTVSLALGLRSGVVLGMQLYEEFLRPWRQIAAVEYGMVGWSVLPIFVYMALGFCGIGRVAAARRRNAAYKKGDPSESTSPVAVGIGVIVEKKAEGSVAVVRSTFHGGAASRAGIRAGDVILEVDGESLVGGSEAVARALLGPEGSTLQLLVEKKGGQQVNLVLRREAPKADGSFSGSLETPQKVTESLALAERSMQRGKVLEDTSDYVGACVDYKQAWLAYCEILGEDSEESSSAHLALQRCRNFMQSSKDLSLSAQNRGMRISPANRSFIGGSKLGRSIYVQATRNDSPSPSASATQSYATSSSASGLNLIASDREQTGRHGPAKLSRVNVEYSA